MEYLPEDTDNEEDEDGEEGTEEEVAS